MAYTALSSKTIAVESITFLTKPGQIVFAGTDYTILYPNSVTRRQYVELFNQFNIAYGEVYSYIDWQTLKRAAQIGIAGNYESLFLSSGGSFFSAEDSIRFNERKLRFDVFYYKNHNITMSVAYKNNPDGIIVFPFAIKKGRHKNLGWQK